MPEQVEVGKTELTATLKKNRNVHQEVFREACEGYAKRVTEVLEEHLERVRSGSLEAVYIQLPKPENHVRDYDRALRMLDMEVNATVVLNETEFSQLVMDDWGWKRQFLTSNSQYSTTAATFLATGD